MENVREAPALAALRRRGFVASFAADGSELRVTGTDQRFRPEDVTIQDYYRFEGVSDPDDMSVIYALEASDGTRGVLVDAFGTYADPAVGALVARMPTLRDSGRWSRVRRIAVAGVVGGVALGVIVLIALRAAGGARSSAAAAATRRGTARRQRLWDAVAAAAPALRTSASSRSRRPGNGTE